MGLTIESEFRETIGLSSYCFSYQHKRCLGGKTKRTGEPCTCVCHFTRRDESLLEIYQYLLLMRNTKYLNPTFSSLKHGYRRSDCPKA